MMRSSALLSIDGAAEIPCTLAIETQTIDASSFSGTSRPDLAWTFVDAAGHFHAFDHEGKLPTLMTRTTWHAYEEPDDETGATGWEEVTTHCVLCGDEINPEYVTSYDLGRRMVPGRTEWKLTFTGDAPPRFSAVVRTEGRTYFGIAETVYRRGVHNPAESLAYGGPMSWRPLPVPAWRLDVPVVPPHITCLKDRRGHLWSLRPDGMWEDEKHQELWTVVELMEHTPLVEHPDPRVAT